MHDSLSIPGRLPLLLAVLALFAGPSAAEGPRSPDGLWTTVDRIPFPTRFSPPTEYSAATLDLRRLLAQLAAAPRDPAGHASAAARTYLPMPDGSFIEIAVRQSKLVDGEIAVMFPELQTFAFVAVTDRDITGRINVGPGGAFISAQAPDRSLRVEPVQTEDGAFYLSYYDRDRTAGGRLFSRADDAPSNKQNVAWLGAAMR